MIDMTLVDLDGQAGKLGLSEDLCNLLLVVHCVLKFLNGSDWLAALGGRNFKFIIERILDCAGFYSPLDYNFKWVNH